VTDVAVSLLTAALPWWVLVASNIVTGVEQILGSADIWQPAVALRST